MSFPKKCVVGAILLGLLALETLSDRPAASGTTGSVRPVLAACDGNPPPPEPDCLAATPTPTPTPPNW